MAPTSWRALITNDGFTPLWASWNAQSPALGHTTGRPDGSGWSANTAQDAPGWLNFGPYFGSTLAGVNPLFLGIVLGDVSMMLFWLVIDTWQGHQHHQLMPG